MALNQIGLPSGPNACWTDILSPDQEPSSTRRVPQATPQMLTRIEAIRSKLPYIKTTLDTRLHLQQIVQNNGSYCAHCTPLGVAGHCDRTCALLRPTDKEYVSFWCEYDDPWLSSIATDVAAYQAIVDDMEARGTQIYAATLGRWERRVAKLMEGCLANTEIEENDG